MLQRHRKPTIQEFTAVARQQLQEDLNTFNQPGSFRKPLTDTAQKILTMLSNVSSPLVATQIIKQKLATNKHPHSLHLQVVLDKAQLFYLQSVTHDLNRLRQEQRIMQISSEDIKQYIQEVNWKMGYDRESILNQSQQIGENIDLMKFFQGVRNYENIFEANQKHCIEKLRQLSIKTQNDLNLKKGFLAGKLIQVKSCIENNFKIQFMSKIKRIWDIQKKTEIFDKLLFKRMQSSFDLVIVKAKNKSCKQILGQILGNWGQKMHTHTLLKQLRILCKKRQKLKSLYEICRHIQSKKKIILYNQFIRRINNSPYLKASNYTISVEKISHFIKRKAIKIIYSKLGLDIKQLFKNIENYYSNNLKYALKNILNHLSQQKVALPISNNIKGKILLSLNNFEQKPPNLRKNFLSWYLKSHEDEYAQRIYNIWLKGNVSKFVFFMRIKNCINQSKKHKIKHQLKVFLLIFMQNMNNYYQHNQKLFISRWHKNNRRSKKVQNLSYKIQRYSQILDTQALSLGFNSIKVNSENKNKVAKYYHIFSKATFGKIKYSFETWKNMPNIRKIKGRTLLIKYLQNKISINNEAMKQAYDKFKQEKRVGRSKKYQLIAKILNKDILYLANYFNKWRQNNKTEHFRDLMAQTTNKYTKQIGLMKLINQIKKNTYLQTVSAVSKFNTKKQFNHCRIVYAKKIFSKLIFKFNKQKMIQTYDIFKQQFNNGKRKKSKLVTNLVTANRIKQAEVFYIFNTFALNELKNQKLRVTQAIFSKLHETIKNQIANPLFLQKNVCFKILQRISINQIDNINSSMKVLKNLPQRIQWKKRQNCVNLYQNLQSLVNKRANNSFGFFKSFHFQGQYKKKRIIDVMAFRYIDTSKNYFKIYNRNIREIIFNEKSKFLTNSFDNLMSIATNNFQVILQGQKVWQKKQQYLKKMNAKIRQKMKFAIKSWHSNSKSMTYFSKIQQQKKRRLLVLFSDCLSKNNYMESKKCINMFHKHSKIIQLQNNFLKRLCDTQAGKVSRAFMVWKGLPVQQNKELIKKASRFQSNLSKYSDKIIRSVFNQFRDIHFSGNERKKIAIKKLVAKNCSGIEKYFAIWKQNNKLTTIYLKTNLLSKIAENIFDKQREYYLNLMQGKKSQKLLIILQNISKKLHAKEYLYFKKWLSQIKYIREQESMKKKMIVKLAKTQKQTQIKKVLNIIKQIKTRSFLKNFFNVYLLQNRIQQAKLSMDSMKGLPDWSKKLQYKKKTQKIRDMVENINYRKRKDINSAFEVFRANRYTGNFRKHKACDSYLKDKIHKIHFILKQWNNLAQNKKKEEKYEKVSHLFGYSYQICRSNFSPVISNIRQIEIKKKSIERLLNVQKIKMQSYLKIWSVRVRQIKVQQQFKNHQKKMILDKINGMLSRNNGEMAKNIVKKFYINSKITGVQTKFLQRLLNTKSGKTMQAFNKWKSIPNQNVMEKYRKGQKFFYKLESLIKNNIVKAQNSFKQNLDEGNSVKKTSVLQLLDITSTGIRRYYNRWDKITKRDITLKQANAIMHSLDTMNDRLIQNFMIIFQDQRTTRIKTWALDKIVQAFSQNKGLYFKIWKQNVRQWKIKESMGKKQKQIALQAFSKVLGKSQKQQTVQIIQKFKKNLHITKISKNFINKLLKTKSGKVVQLFELWKSIPDIKFAQKKKRAIKFQSNLNKMVHKFIKKGFEPFKSESYEGKNKKKKCIDRLIRASMGQQKKKFILWRQIIKQDKILAHSQIFGRVFQHINDQFGSSMNLLIKDAKNQVIKKQKLCRIMINNSNFVQHHAYFIWKDALQVDNIKIQKEQAKVKVYLNNLINVEKKVTNRKLINIIACLKNIQSKKNLQQNKKKWNDKHKKSIKFYEGLQKFGNKKLGVFLQCIKLQNVQYKFLSKTTQVDKSFQLMNNAFAEGFQIIMRSNRQTIIIEKAINKLMINFSASTQRIFNIWRQNKNIMNLQMQMSTQKKKNILGIINKVLEKQEKSQLPNIIQKFKTNYRQNKLQKQILNKILHSKAGRVPLAFMKWKSIPNQGAKKMKQKAMKFQAGLARIVFSKMKKTYETFKDKQFQGMSKKRLAINKIFSATMSDSNRYFNKWRKTSHEGKITEKMINLNRTFELLTNNSQSNLQILFKNSQYECLIKRESIKNLFKNIQQNYKTAFLLWKKQVKLNKQVVLERVFTKYGDFHFTRKRLQYSFYCIKKRADTQVVRAYINSLWKWKMSNFQANYYSKFIKIFKQSQELLSLSTALNKRKYQNLHSAFRAILLTGNSRHLRKQRITEKYLTRKIKNYFDRFKLNACFTEIKLWKQNYSQTVKAKTLNQSLQKFFRKQQKQGFDKLLNNSSIIQNTLIFEQKINEVKLKYFRQSILRIYSMSFRRFIDKTDRVLISIQNRMKQQSYQCVITYGKIEFLAEKIDYLSTRFNNREVFQKISKKALKNIQLKFAIRYLANMQDQKLKNRKLHAIERFSQLAQKIHTMRNISIMINYKEANNSRHFFNIMKKIKNTQRLLSCFHKGMVIKKILDAQDKKLKKKMFERMKKKENPWMQRSLQRFLLRSNIKSSMSVSLYRLKTFSPFNQ